VLDQLWPAASGGTDDPLEGFGLSAEDSAALHAIMSVGQERLGFLGG
jgi:hypothetical protein